MIIKLTKRQDLARQLPALADVRRLNKHMIVQESVSRHAQQRATCLSAWHQIQALIAERAALLEEVNAWRSGRLQSPQPLAPRQANPLDTSLIQELSDAETEVFGTFPNGFKNNPPNEDGQSHTPRAGSQSDTDALGPTAMARPHSPAAQPPPANMDRSLPLVNTVDSSHDWSMSTEEFPGLVLPSLDQVGEVQNATTTMEVMPTPSLYHFKAMYGQVGPHEPGIVNFAPDVSQLEAAANLSEDWTACFSNTHEFLMPVENFDSI